MAFKKCLAFAKMPCLALALQKMPYLALALENMPCLGLEALLKMNALALALP